MSEDIIVKQCAPTLAGVKTGNLFTCPYDSKEELIKDIRRVNKLLVPKGLCLCPLKYSKTFCLLYLYRPKSLKEDFENEEIQNLLKENGYKQTTYERCIGQLARRMTRDLKNSDFPHEIGLFLGYPPEDVKGFIENKAENYKMSGLWKVYGDKEKAESLFAKYKKCTEIYCNMWKSGASLDELAVQN